MNVYTIRDVVSEVSMPPFVAENDIVVSRLVRDAARQPEGLIGKYPADFVVQHVGTWDPESGVLTALAGARILGKVVDLLPPPPPLQTQASEPVERVLGA